MGLCLYMNTLHFPNLILIKFNFQEWRFDKLGKIGGKRIELLNILEKVQNSETSSYSGMWAPFDQFAVAVALDRKCIKQSTKYKVKFPTRQ